MSWGPLVDSRQWKFKGVPSGVVASMISRFTKEREVFDDLCQELSRVRKAVFREQHLMKHTSSRSRDVRAKRDQVSLLSRRKRLMYLFVKDLSSGICGEVLANKAQRDAFSRLESTTSSVTVTTKMISWMFVCLMNMGMLLYVYLFAMTQTQSRQSAWFQSFVIWIIFEIFVSSTGLVVFFHLLVPLYVFTEVSKIKEKVLLDLISFRKKYLRRFAKVDEERVGSDAGLDFNAAKYLFISWRVASLVPELPESGLILQFSTPWPKKKFGAEVSKVSQEYDQAVILTAFSRVLMFFIASLLHHHMLIQDIIVQLVFNSGFAALILLMIQVARIHPLLPVACVLVLLLAVFLMLQFTLPRRHQGLVKSLRRQSPQSLVHPSAPLHLPESSCQPTSKYYSNHPSDSLGRTHDDHREEKLDENGHTHFILPDQEDRITSRNDVAETPIGAPDIHHP